MKLNLDHAICYKLLETGVLAKHQINDYQFFFCGGGAGGVGWG